MQRRTVRVMTLLAVLLLSVMILAVGADDVIILGMKEEPQSFDVQKISGGTGMILGHLVYDYLIHYTADGDRIPGLAKSWEVAEDVSSITCHLREGVTFHDGTAFNASAVKYNFDRLMDPDEGCPIGSKIADTIASIETPDEMTVVFNLSKPDVSLIAMLGEVTNSVIISPAAIEKYGDSIGSNPVGTGPFRFATWELGQRVVFDRNENYWGGAPLPKHIIARSIPDAATRLVELETGGVHFLDSVEPAQMEFIEDDLSLVLHVKPTSSLYALWFNQNQDLFKDLNVRKAIALAIDVDTIVEVLCGSAVVRSQGPVPIMNEGHDPNIVEPGYDLEEAKRLLSNSGWALGADGVYEKDGEKLEFSIMTPDGHYVQDKQICQAVQDQLNQFGMSVSLRVLEYGSFDVDWMASNFDMCIDGGRFTDNDPARGPMYLFLGDTRYNVYGFVHEELQAAFESIRTNGDFEARKALAWEAQEIINDAVVAVWLYNMSAMVATTSQLQGYEHNGIGFLNLNDVYLSD